MKPTATRRRLRRIMLQHVIKEICLAGLALLSVGLLLWEFLDSPTATQQRAIYRIEFGIALVFLADFMWGLFHTPYKRHYLRRNWFLLLACIPLAESWAEALHGLRLLVVVRIFRAEEHVRYAEHYIASTSHRTRPPQSPRPR